MSTAQDEALCKIAAADAAFLADNSPAAICAVEGLLRLGLATFSGDDGAPRLTDLGVARHDMLARPRALRRPR